LACPDQLCPPAVDWALHDYGPTLAAFYQGYSLRAAQGLFVDAFRGEALAERDAAFADMFYSLGNVLHLLQDVSQPEHVRNDFHFKNDWPFGWHSHLEPDARATFGKGLEPENQMDHYGADQGNSASAKPAIAIPRELFIGEHGLSNYANLNFVSDDTNLTRPYIVSGLPPMLSISATSDSDFGEPSASERPLVSRTWAEIKDEFPTYLALPPPENEPLPDGRIYFVEFPVSDLVEPGDSQTNSYGTTLSIYAWDFGQYHPDPCLGNDALLCDQMSFTQNFLNYRAARHFLMPRAISYGRALINHFFRGVWRDGKPVLELTAAAANGRFADVRNVGPEPLTDGSLIVYYDSRDGTRHELVRREGDIPAGGVVLVGSATDWSTLRSDVEPGGEVAFLWDGRIGTDPRDISVAGRICDCGEAVTLAADDPDVDCKAFCPQAPFVNSAGLSTFDREADQWTFAAEPGLPYGNTDWFGKTGTLSWVGPAGRYFEPQCGSPYLGSMPMNREELSNVVYEKGATYTAPGPVLGAALRRVESGGQVRRFLLAIVAVANPSSPGGMGLRAYRADLASTPLDWEPGPEIMLDEASAVSLAPFYFNSSGTEAQSVGKLPSDDPIDLTPNYFRFVFSWKEGFDVELLGPSQDYPNGEWDPVEGGTVRWHFYAADYRGDEPVLAHDERTFTQTSNATCPVIQTETGTLGVTAAGTLPTVSYQYDSGCSVSPTLETVTMDDLRILHLDLRTPSPTIVAHRLALDGVYVNSVFLHVVTPVWRIDAQLPHCAETLSATTNSDGHGVVAWADWGVAQLYPAGDLGSLTGATGPVGLF